MSEIQAGMFCLGGFVGAIATFGLKFIQNYSNFAKALTTILSATLGGAVIFFIKKFQGTQSISAYCAGLLVALMWAYAGDAKSNIESSKGQLQILGWMHIFGTIVATVVAAFVFAFPLVVKVWRESLAQ